MSQKVLFVGDANVDLILSGLVDKPLEDKEVYCKEIQWTLGGSSTLTCSAYAHLGGDCDFCGMVGDDENGKCVRQALINAGVGVRLFRMEPKIKTGVTVNLIQGRNRTQITYRGNLSETDESKVIKKEICNYSHLHLAGIYGTEKLLPKIQNILVQAKKHGVTISLDTQWDVSETWAYLSDWLPFIDWLIINNHEAASIAQHFGFPKEESDCIEKIWTFLKERTTSPIIKLGKHGAYANGKFYPPCEVSQIVDTTGAGDSFAAAFIYAMKVLKCDFEGAMVFAQAGGALACTYVGGYSSQFSVHAVKALITSE